MKRGKIIVKQSLSDAYRQYLEDVTIPMNTYLDAPEEFVTTKPSIYHSLRMQPATDAKTGRVRNSPARARALSSLDNLQFQNDIRDFSLPLSTNQGLPLYGRHVYPGELYSFNPSFGKETHLPDLPVTYKTTWGDGTKNRPLNLYGFTGDAPTPQRFTSSTFQPEGIIYGNLDTNDVIQLNTRPASAERFAQVARALSPFHPSRDVKDLGVHSEDLARDIMDAGIPPILAESNVDTKGITHHLPFRLDEPIDVKEAHDPFAQYDMGNLNRPTPEGLGQFTLDAIRAGEPMDITMQLLKEEIPYSSRDYPPQEISISTGNPLMTPKIAGETPEVCNMPGCESGLPPVMYRRMANPIRSIDNHEFMCEQCAYKHDLQSLLFDKMIKGEITLIDYTLQILKNQFKLNEDFTSLRDEAHEGKKENWDGRGRWNEMKNPISEEYGDEPIPGASWKKPFDLEGFDPKDKSKDFDESGAALPLHFYNQLKRIPMLNQPTAKRILQMALNTGQGMADGSVDKPYELSDFVDFNNIQTSEPMKLAMQLLKQEPLQLRNSAELAELARQGDMEAYNEMMERTGDYYLANEITGEPDMEANLEAYGAETGKNPFKNPPIGRTNQIQIHQPPVTPVHADKKLHNWQYKNASEPMELAMQLLKERVSPEAKRHKLEYDKKYESSPERVKYREELNRERRRRNIMGRGGPDMSHTKDHTIVPESPHTNRARHFKDKGTLL